MRQYCGRATIHVHEAFFRRGIVVQKLAVVGKARVVDEHADVEVLGLPGDLREKIRRVKVGHYAATLDAMPVAQLASEGVKPLAAPGQQNKIYPCRGHLPGEFLAYAGGRAGNQRPFAIAVFKRFAAHRRSCLLRIMRLSWRGFHAHIKAGAMPRHDLGKP